MTFRSDPTPASSPTPAPRVVVAGFGLLSPLGQSAWETFTALLAGRTIADRCAALPDDIAPVDLVRAVGSVRVVHHAGGDPAVELAERAAREACTAAGVDPTGLTAYVGASKGAVASLLDGRRDRCLAVTLGPHGFLTHKLRERLHLGLTRHYVAACASSLTALHHAFLDLTRTASAGSASTASDFALVLTSEAALLPHFIHSYRRLGVLAPQRPRDYRELPLDARRQGFMLSELGAAVLLRRLPVGLEPKIGEIELVDTGIACEANDLVRPSPTMDALDRVAAQLFASLPADTSLDMLHPHAPGTADHDPTELRILRTALARARGDAELPDLYAYKGALGHGLGAAGLTAFVLACLSLTAGQRPPLPWLDEPMDEAVAAYNDGVQPLSVGRFCSRTGVHTVFSAGFAGHVAGALLRRH